MNTRKKLNNIGFFALLLIFIVLSSCKNKHENHQQENSHEQHSDAVYTCPMHPEIIRNQPGDCPICKMKLVLFEEELIQAISPSNYVLSRQATVKQQSSSNGDIIKAQGYITTNPNRNKSVAARFGGRIEKLYVKFSNQYVKQGDKIMDIYSPDLRTFQEEHLFILKSNNEHSLKEKSRAKLRLLGVTDNQITQLEKNGTVALTISVFSHATGYVFFSEQLKQSNSGAKNNPTMNTLNMKQSTNNESYYASSASPIREGIYVNEGQTLFSVNDLQEVWALISVSNQNANQIHENQPVQIVSENNPSKTLKGKVTLIEQTFEEANQRFARVRIVLPNPNNSLKINSLVSAQFALSGSKNLQVPSSAIYKTGLAAYVWVKTDTTINGTGIFQLRKVIAGASSSGMTTIKSGLFRREEIAKEAGLMTDSETFLNGN